MLEIKKTTLQKEAILQADNVIYNVNITAVNNELTRLNCAITKKAIVQHSDGAGGQTPVEENVQIGHITLEYGRQITEIIHGENLIPHLTKFQEILDEVLAKESEVKTTKK